MKWSTLGSGTQRSLSHTAEKRSEGMVEASLSNALGRVGFLVSHRRLLPVMCHNLRDDVRCLPATALTTPSLLQR